MLCAAVVLATSMSILLYRDCQTLSKQECFPGSVITPELRDRISNIFKPSGELKRMDNKKYLKLCGILSAVIVFSLLFIPGFADAIETAMLGFLMVNARA